MSNPNEFHTGLKARGRGSENNMTSITNLVAALRTQEIHRLEHNRKHDEEHLTEIISEEEWFQYVKIWNEENIKLSEEIGALKQAVLDEQRIVILIPQKVKPQKTETDDLTPDGFLLPGDVKYPPTTINDTLKFEYVLLLQVIVSILDPEFDTELGQNVCREYSALKTAIKSGVE